MPTLTAAKARFRTRPLDQIVPVSAVAAKLLQIPLGQGVPFQVYADIISRDPPFSAQVLAMANSPLLSLRTPVSSILQALCVLGQDRLNALIAMLAFYRLVNQAKPGPAYRAYWRHSVATAVLAERLAAAYTEPRGHEYPAALLHNLGALVFLREDPAGYEEALSSSPSNQSLLEHEHQLFGEDHGELGSRLMRAWQLPEPFQSAALDHNRPATLSATASALRVASSASATATLEYLPFAAWVAVASSLAASAGFGFGPPELDPAALQDLPASEIAGLVEGLDERINAIECSLGA